MARRRNHAPAFKARVALAALSGHKTVAELSAEYGVHQTLINAWVRQLKDGAAGVFSGEKQIDERKTAKAIEKLHAKVGQLTMERDFLAEAWGKL